MSLFSRLFGKRPDDRAEVRPLWHRVVELSRDPAWYATCGVADSVPGRFDAITLVLCAALLRMERDPALGVQTARLTELFVEDMDGQLRESGVGDLVVGKHIGRLMSVLGGRLGAYREALAGGSDAALAEAIDRNVSLGDGRDPALAAARFRALAAEVDALPADKLLAGEFGA
ncbi:MAG: ubiquinol-cytochrome C chaperone family protein [Novosphingobium sp.]